MTSEPLGLPTSFRLHPKSFFDERRCPRSRGQSTSQSPGTWPSRRSDKCPPHRAAAVAVAARSSRTQAANEALPHVGRRSSPAHPSNRGPSHSPGVSPGAGLWRPLLRWLRRRKHAARPLAAASRGSHVRSTSRSDGRRLEATRTPRTWHKTRRPTA